MRSPRLGSVTKAPRIRKLAGIASLALVAALGVAAAPAASAHTTGHGTVVVSGLDNPRGLTIGWNGALYVAEAGHGGATCIPGGEQGTTCLGLTGGVSRVTGGRATRVVSGLISAADPNGQFAEGMVSVSALGPALFGQFGGNTSLVPTGGPSTPVTRAAHAFLGQSVITYRGHAIPFAGVGDFDYAWSKDHKALNPQFPDSNPNAILASPHGLYVVDAGANTLDLVGWNRSITVLAYFDVPKGAPSDAVPTCIARGPDGALYIGELLGGYFDPGHARVWRYAHGRATVWRTGFTAMNGCGFDRRGNFYATEFQTGGLGAASPAGALVRVAPNGTRTTLGAGQLFTPSGFAAQGHAVYVSNWSIMPASNPGGPTGQVMRFATS